MYRVLWVIMGTSIHVQGVVAYNGYFHNVHGVVAYNGYFHNVHGVVAYNGYFHTCTGCCGL